MGIEKVDAGPNGGKLEFGSSTEVDPLTIVQLVQSQPQNYRLEGADKLRFTLELENHDERIEAVNTLINRLLPKKKAK